ncbi:hypothetical protein N1032_01285 [Herbiconiux sp. CPCC 203386]|uniref:Uncharacterized protein n=1 Tax=Herbiconiux daphne TaxID=2970914 RepID=A0ABT2GWV4_9MICO|nr:hypothetical protein [Herbiconiux daphne]
MTGRARWHGDFAHHLATQELGANGNSGWMLLAQGVRVFLIEDVFVRLATAVREAELEHKGRDVLPHFDTVAESAHWDIVKRELSSYERWAFFHQPTQWSARLSLTSAQAADRVLTEECDIAETRRSQKRSTGKRYRAVLKEKSPDLGKQAGLAHQHIEGDTLK